MLCVPDVHSGSIPTSQQNKEFSKSNGWPDGSRAVDTYDSLKFFNKDW